MDFKLIVLLCLLAIWIAQLTSAAPLPEEWHGPSVNATLFHDKSTDPDIMNFYKFLEGLYEPLPKSTIHEVENSYDRISSMIFKASNRTEYHENLRKEYKVVMNLILTVRPGSPDYDFCRLMLSNYISLGHHEYASAWKQRLERGYFIKVEKEIYGFMEDQGIPIWNPKKDFWAGTTPSPYDFKFQKHTPLITIPPRPTTPRPTTPKPSLNWFERLFGKRN